MRRYIDVAYLMLLGITLGLVLTLGAIVAPTIFHADKFLGSGILDHYQMGLLMSAIFIKSNYVLNFTAIAILLREGYAYKSFERDSIAIPSAATAVLMIFLFTLYYTKEILSLQAMGDEVTNSNTFASVHKASELDFQLLALSLALLLGRRLYLVMKVK